MRNVPDSDFPKWVNRRVRLKRLAGDEEHVGQIIGRGESVIAVGPSEVVQSWLLRTSSSDVHFAPTVGWDIELLEGEPT